MKRIFACVICLLLAAPLWRGARAQVPNEAIQKMDAGLDAIVPAGSQLENLVHGSFEGGEGPVWVSEGRAGYLLFTASGSRVYKWTPDCFLYPCPASGKLTVFLEHSGERNFSSGAPPAPGSNGLTLDPQKRLLLAAGGARAILRLERDGTRSIVADYYDGKRIGCPNDLASRSDGGVYFTDSGGGCIPGGEQNADLSFHGVYFAKNGKVQLLDQDPGGFPPNGIALSADEKVLYVTNGGPAPQRRQIFAYDVQPDGSTRNRRLFLDLAGEQGLGGPDGIRVDNEGNLYAAATGGVWIVSPAGKRLGRILAPPQVRFSNLAFGDPDGKTLYMVSDGNLWRIRLKIPGLR